MPTPTLSIVTPSFEQVEYVERTLRSVMEQSYDDVEHVVVDGGSTDGTVAVLEAYEDRYDLRWVSEPDLGQSHAVNKGLEMANGDWIGWQNSDDFYLSGAFETVADAFEADPEPIAVYGDLLVVDGDGEEVTRQFVTRPSPFVQRYWSLFASNQSLFVKADVFRHLGGLSEEYTYAMDADLTWRLLQHGGPLHRVEAVLGAFRIQEEGKTYGDVSHLTRAELDAIYGYSGLERSLPLPLLRTLARAGKFVNLCWDGRWEALRYNLASALPHGSPTGDVTG